MRSQFGNKQPTNKNSLKENVERNNYANNFVQTEQSIVKRTKLNTRLSSNGSNP